MGVSVCDELCGEPKPSIDVVKIQLGDPHPSDSGETWQEYGAPGAPMVDNGEDGVMALNRGRPVIRSMQTCWKGSASGSVVIR